MSSATQPLPPPRRVGGVAVLRRGAAWLHLALALAIALGVFLQVYLIGAYIFGAGSEALDAHTTVGFTVHALEVLLFLVALVAWLPRADVGLSLLMALLGTTQIALAEAPAGRAGCTRSGRCSCSCSPPRSFAATFSVATPRGISAVRRCDACAAERQC